MKRSPSKAKLHFSIIKYTRVQLKWSYPSPKLKFGIYIYCNLKLGPLALKRLVTCPFPIRNDQFMPFQRRSTTSINQSTGRPGPVGPTVLGLRITVCFLARDFLPHASSNLSPCVLQPSNSCSPATNDEGGCLLDYHCNHHESKWHSSSNWL